MTRSATQAGKFLTALVERYRDKPATLGYDVWNEGAVQECFCPATQAKFREWLKAKYGTIEALGRAWHRYSFGDWDSVHPPHSTGGYPDSLDWLAFRRDDAIRLLHWRTELIRRLDKRNKITAHSTGLLTEIEWRTAADVDSYGYTWVASRHGNDPWMQFQAVDVVRARLAREAVLARGGDRRAALDAAAGDQPPAGRRPQLGR